MPLIKMAPPATPTTRQATRTTPRRRTLSRQLGLRARGQRGGWRQGAGRPKGSRTSSRIPHRSRPALSRHQAAHVTVKVLPMRRSLRSPRARLALEAIFVAEKRRQGFRLLHYCIRRDHIHLVCESDDALKLSRAMQRLGSRIARSLNRLWDRTGSFFADRYHGRVITTPRELRNVLRYVLLNLHKDALIQDGQLLGGGFDPCSSARWFDGWHPSEPRPPPDEREPAVTEPKSWLARQGWRRHGLLRPSELAKAWVRAVR